MKKTFLSAVLAGISISFGCMAFLSVENRVVGAALFAVGLFNVCTMKLHLYTGKACYIFQNDKRYLFSLPIIWIGNLLGTSIIAGIIRLSRIGVLSERALSMCETKLNDSLLSVFLLALLCNFFIYIGVDGFANNPHTIGKYLSIFFGVMIFILCGLEHCVANMFYFLVAGLWDTDVLVTLLVMTLGNTVGGVIFPLIRKILDS